MKRQHSQPAPPISWKNIIRVANERAERVQQKALADGALTLDAFIARLQELRAAHPDLGAQLVSVVEDKHDGDELLEEDKPIKDVRAWTLVLPDGLCNGTRIATRKIRWNR